MGRKGCTASLLCHERNLYWHLPCQLDLRKIALPPLWIFAIIYMYLSNFMEEYHTRQCLACSQTPRSVCSFIRCVHSLFRLHLGCGCPIDSRQYYVTTWGCCTIVCDHMKILYHCMWPHEDAVPLYVTTWGCCTIVCDHMGMLYHCMWPHEDAVPLYVTTWGCCNPPRKCRHIQYLGYMLHMHCVWCIVYLHMVSMCLYKSVCVFIHWTGLDCMEWTVDWTVYTALQ